MLGKIASVLREEGVEFEHSRVSYASIGGGVASQERIVVFSRDAKLIVSHIEGSEYTELRITFFQGLPEQLASMLEERGAVIDDAPGEPHRIVLRVKRVDPALIRGLARFIGGSP